MIMLDGLQALSLQNSSYRRVLLSGTIGFIALHLLWLLWGSQNDQERYLAGNLSLVFTGCVSALLAFKVRRQLIRSGEDQSHQVRVWNWIGAGLTIWTLGDLTRMVLEKVAPQSLSTFIPLELIYLDGSLALLVGLLLMPRQSREGVGPIRLLLDMTITSSAVITLAWLSVFKPAYDALLSGQGTTSTIIYSALDLVLLLALINLFLISQPASLPRSFGWIASALAVYTVTDLAYSYLMMKDAYQSGSLVSFGWVLGDGFAIRAALVQLARYANGTGPTRLNRVSIMASTSIQSLLPLLVTVIMGLYTIVNWQFSSQLEQLGLWVTVVLGLGLIGRQGILAGEYEFQQYASLVNSVAEPTFICDRRGSIRLVNPAFLQAAGYEKATNFSEQPLKRLMILPGKLEEIFSEALQAGWSGEGQLLRADGATIPVSLALRPIISGVDRVLALAGTAHDLREYKQQQAVIQQAYEQIARAHAELEGLNSQLEEKVFEKTASLSEAYLQLEEQNRELQTLDLMKSDFVSLVSHELRAPLTNINGGIELVLSHPNPLPARVKSTIELVQAEIQRLTRFVETILDLSALEAGRTPIYPAPLHLSTIVTSLQNQMRHLPGSERVHWQIPAEIPFVLADEQALTSVLFHLLDNALKYAPEGEIVVSAGLRSTRAWVQVADEGPGIPPEALPHLFSRFFRSRASDSQTVYGHGLGLYIVSRLIQAMNGEIQVTNRPLAGACFTCWLPALIPSGDETGLESTLFNGYNPEASQQ
jgi:PAS domain S-box-containing protein